MLKLLDTISLRQGCCLSDRWWGFCVNAIQIILFLVPFMNVKLSLIKFDALQRKHFYDVSNCQNINLLASFFSDSSGLGGFI